MAELHHPNLVRLFDLRQHEGQWFFTMELVHGQDGVLIGWSEASLPPDTPTPALAVEVRLYDLGGGWVQARWNLQLAEGNAELQQWADALLVSLRRLLADRPLWQVDGP